MTTKAQIDFLKFKTLCFKKKHKKLYASKDTIKKDNSENGGKYLQIMYLIKNYNQNMYIHTYI